MRAIGNHRGPGPIQNPQSAALSANSASIANAVCRQIVRAPTHQAGMAKRHGIGRSMSQHPNNRGVGGKMLPYRLRSKLEAS